MSTHSMSAAAALVAWCSSVAFGQFTATPMRPSGVTSPTFVQGVSGSLRIGWSFSFPTHGWLWTGSDPNGQDFGAGSLLYAINGSQFGGGLNGHPCFWNGSLANRVDLGSSNAALHALAGNQQVGDRTDTASHFHATLWTGTAASQVDLSPAGYQDSHGTATDGDRQFGWGIDANDQIHALAWNDTAASFQDFTPPSGYAEILGAGGGIQVGNANGRAALWHGTPASYVDLQPAGYSGSQCDGTNGDVQVGYAVSPTGNHAGIWFGTAASFIDLHAFLPAGYTSSEALSASYDGGTLVIGGYGTNSGGQQDPFIWVAVPTPSAAASLLFAGPLLARRRRAPRD
jgi:hypothetical protein